MRMQIDVVVLALVAISATNPLSRDFISAEATSVGVCDWSEGVRAGYTAYLDHDLWGARAHFEQVIAGVSVHTERCNVVAALNNLAVLDLLEDRADAALVKLEETLSLDQLDDIALRNLGWAQQQHPVGDAYFGSTDAYNRLLDLTVLRFLIATSKRQKPVDMHVFARHTRGVFRDFQTKMQQMKRARIGQLRFPALNVTVLVDAMRVDKGAKITDGIMQLWVEETSFEGQATRVLETTPATETEMESPIASQILADRSLELSIFERPVWHTATTTNLPLCGFAYRAQPPQDTRLFDVTGNTLRGVSGPPVGVLVSLRGMHLEQIKRTLTGLYDRRYALETSAATMTVEEAGGPLELLLKSPGRAQRQEYHLSCTEGYSTMGLLTLAQVRNESDPLVTVPGLTQASLATMNHLETVVEAIMRDGIEGDVLEAGTWRGGLSIWMAAVLQAHQLYSDLATQTKKRVVWVADSFQGVPPPRKVLDEINDDTYTWEPNRYAVGMDAVRLNFLRYGFHNARAAGTGPEPKHEVMSPLLTMTPIRFIQGYFNESLPRAVRDTVANVILDGGGEVPPEDQPGPRALAILRLDADSYEGTLDILTAMYHLLSPGGFVLVDDFHLVGARQAVRQFRKERDIREPMLPIPEGYVYGCRQGRGGVDYHTFPDKPVQGMYWRRAM